MAHHPNMDEYVRQIDSGARDYWQRGAMPANMGPLGWYVVRPWHGAPFVKHCYATSFLCKVEGPFGSFDEAYKIVEEEVQ